MSKKDKKLDPRVVRTCQLLRAALINLIPQKGFAAISIQDITDQATLNRATFYLHYRDKTELLMEVFEELMAGVTPLPPEEGHPPIQPVSVSIARVFERVGQHADFFRVMLAEESVPMFNARIRQYVEDVGLKWISALQPEEDKILVPPEIAISFLGSAYLGAIVWWLQKGMPHPPDYMANQLIQLTALGLYGSLGLETPPRLS